MAVQTGSQRTSTSYASYEEEHGQGWIMFAAVLLLTLGSLNVIDRIAAISEAAISSAPFWRSSALNPVVDMRSHPNIFAFSSPHKSIQFCNG